jgi:hypothetical protein
MANNLSDYLENELLDHVTGKTAYTMPTPYLALFTTLPGEDGTGGVEVSTSGTAYARQACSGATWNAASGGSISTASDVTFPAATASWGTIVGVGLYDGDVEGAGNLLWYGTVGTSKTIDSGDTAKVSAGDLTLSLN